MKSNLLCPLIRAGIRPPLFIVPSAGVTPISLVRLARSLKSQRPVYTFKFAGLDDDQTPHKSIDEMGACYVAEIREMQKSGPYYIAGHCLGGIVALDMAAKLEGGGDTVAVLALLESIPPLIRAAAPERDSPGERDQSARASIETEKALHLTFDEIRGKLSLLPPVLAKRVGEFCAEQIRMSLCFRGNPIDGAIALLRTSTHPDVVFQGWRRFSKSSLIEHIVPGDAFSIMAPPHVYTLGARLDKVLGIT